MSDNLDINSLTKDQLKEQANILGIEIKGNPTVDALRDTLREALGDEKPSDTPATREDTGIAVRKGEKRYTIQIHKDGKDKQPIFLGCNGRTVCIKRGETVVIGEGLYQSLKNAVESRLDTETEEWQDVPSYPYTVLSVED